jgi:quinol monooxygenase YgiN
MYVVVWRFEVKPEHVSDFKVHYGPNGSWAALFRRNSSYIRTDLLHDRQRPAEFLTLDYWQDKASYQEFQSRSREAYTDLDHECESLTLREELLGDFDVSES